MQLNEEQQTADNGSGSTREEKALRVGARVPHNSSSDQQELASRGTGRQVASRCGGGHSEVLRR